MKFTSILAMIAAANGLGLSAESTFTPVNYRYQYDEYVAHYNQQLAGYEAAVNGKAAQCNGGNLGRPGDKISSIDGKPSTYTKAYSHYVGPAIPNLYDRLFKNSPNKQQCESVDCLHPCYGAAHEINCYTCSRALIDQNFYNSYGKKNVDMACEGCSVPPKEFDVPKLMSYNEFVAHVQG